MQGMLRQSLSTSPSLLLVLWILRRHEQQKRYVGFRSA
jgi:hypothetical protein